MVKTETFTRRYKSTLESEELMFEDVNRFLDEHNLHGRMAHVFRLCVSEAFTNALEHGNKFVPDKIVSLKMQVNEETVIADIEDEGAGGLEEIARRKRAKSDDEGGRGVDLIYRHAAKTEISESTTGGVRVRMVFNRGAFHSQEREKAN